MFDPMTFIDVACKLSKPDGTEAEYRTAVSRVLYAIFLTAREELDRTGVRVKESDPAKKGLEHGNVRAAFKRGRFRHDQLSQRLGALYDLRTSGDYELGSTIARDDVLQAFEYARYIQSAFGVVFRQMDA